MYLKFGATWFQVDPPLSICVTCAKYACVSKFSYRCRYLSSVLFQYGFVLYEIVCKQFFG
jgi:hypothetical protein